MELDYLSDVLYKNKSHFILILIRITCSTKAKTKKNSKALKVVVIQKKSNHITSTLMEYFNLDLKLGTQPIQLMMIVGKK